MYDVLDLIEDHSSLEGVLLGLECHVSQTYFFESMVDEIRICETKLANEIEKGTALHQQVSALKQAYETTVNYMVELSSL